MKVKRTHIFAGNYKVVKTGTTCNRVMTVAECEWAAQELGLSDFDGKATVFQASGRIPYCWHSGSNIYFNTDSTSTFACGAYSSQWVCICKA